MPSNFGASEYQTQVNWGRKARSKGDFGLSYKRLQINHMLGLANELPMAEIFAEFPWAGIVGSR